MHPGPALGQRIRRPDLGRGRPRRHHVRAGSADCAVVAHRRRGYNRQRSVGRAVRVRHPPRRMGAGAREPDTRTDRVRRGGALGIAGTEVLPDRHPRHRDRRHTHPGGPEDPDVPRRREPRSASLGEPRCIRPRRDPSGHVGYGMGIHQCVGQHVARLESRPCSPLSLPASRRSQSQVRCGGI